VHGHSGLRRRTVPEPVSQSPETHYLRTFDGVYVAYQVVGDGPADVVIGLNSDEGNVDLIWDEPDWRPFLVGPAEFARVILHDRRGTGVSSRNVPPPNLETRVSDLLAVLDEVGSRRPVLVGSIEPGAMHAMFAATHPDRVSGLLWNNPAARMAWAPDYPWGRLPAEFESSIDRVKEWGTAGNARFIAGVRAAEHGVPYSEQAEADRARIQAFARMNRNTVSPDVAEQIIRIWWQTDVRAVLPSVQAPTALITGENDKVDETRYVASLMPNADVHVLPGQSGFSAEPILQILRKLCGAPPNSSALDTVLAAVLFTDIVDSTVHQSALGDRRWKELILAHHAIVRDALRRWHGREHDTAGDGFFATFEGPARAIYCAREITQRVADLGIEVRAGVHIGECEQIDGKVGGIAVAVGARIVTKASPSQVVVSRTVKDLVAGSGLLFADIGQYDLKGLTDRWQLYQVVD
jgi:class 3 adenylate cyclase/pimeloyl-ACP methyl ester carboxylesterase